MSSREPDSELLELYNRQTSNKSFANLNNPRNSNYTNFDNISNQYYKLVDNDIVQDSFDREPSKQDLTPPRHTNIAKPNQKFASNSLNNGSFNSPSQFSSSTDQQPTNRQSRRMPINNNNSDFTRFPVIEARDRSGGNGEPRSDSVNSVDSNGAKKIIKWNLWWDKPESNIKVPFSYIPEYKKTVNAKVSIIPSCVGLFFSTVFRNFLFDF